MPFDFRQQSYYMIVIVCLKCSTHAGVTYIDDNLTARMSSLYLAIFFVMGPAGSAVGFIVGGYFASLYTDFDRVDDSE